MSYIPSTLSSDNLIRFSASLLFSKCLKNVEDDDDDDDDSEKYNSKMDTKSNQSSKYENDKVEVDDDNDAQNMSFDSIG
ncbi:hypothetical protein RhiirA4_489198, partial [Rhizophagus irregularis]